MTLSDVMAKFPVAKKIKKGGQKTVYKVSDYLGKLFALKIIGNATDARVLQEIELVQKLELTNVPRIIESGVAFDEQIGEEVLYIIEEYIDGVSLRDWLEEGNKANLKHAFLILHSLLAVEVELEEKGILHRDINPNNVLLGDNKKIYLIDFGLAKNLSGRSLTRTSAQHGPFTPGYAPYEQFANIKNAQDVRTDLFQIGVTIYESCMGKNPFYNSQDSLYDVMTKTITLVPQPIVLKGDEKGLFAQYIDMLMSKNQSQRPNSAADAMRYLKAVELTLKMEE